MVTMIFPFAMARKVAEDLVVALRRRAEQESEAHAACLRESRGLEFQKTQDVNLRCLRFNLISKGFKHEVPSANRAF